MLKFQKPLFGLLVGLGVALIPIGLQLAYNQYAYGEFLADSYAQESFNRWDKLHLLEFWFGANNGVFIYIPILLLVVLWIISQLRKQNYSSLLFAGYFMAISITYAAWWSPTLGCGFGHRGFTEHLAFFALPMAGLIRSLKPQAIKIAWVITLLIFILLFVAQYNFDDCWRGDGAWDWMEGSYRPWQFSISWDLLKKRPAASCVGAPDGQPGRDLFGPKMRKKMRWSRGN